MSINGPRSGVELINRMQQGGNEDLRKSWVCFDHVQRVGPRDANNFHLRDERRRHKSSDWVSPTVVVPKKNGKLRVYVNLKKMNAATIHDNYPLPITDHVLKGIAGKEAYSFLDGFSRYNQLLIDPKDQHKTAFATEWGIFAYKDMPFGLTNAPATFQSLMSHAFKEYLRNFLEVYMDDLCIHSSIRVDHFEHLKKVIEKCKLYRICLNLEKCIFMARQGKQLGHIVSKNGIATNMDKIHVIVDLSRPTTFNEVRAFMGHCGYYR
ncbi:hypothetical protein L7F22_064598 [Adiantum nelumboides]|nr:hypothetical protein [Adiantum nelumboides]